jgi:hypothetical protein
MYIYIKVLRNEETHRNRLADTAGQYLYCKESVRKPKLLLQAEKITSSPRYVLSLDWIHRRQEDDENHQ